MALAVSTPPTTPGTEKTERLLTPKQDASDIIAELATLSTSISEGNDAARLRALALARQLTGELSKPVDNAMTTIFTPFVAFAVQTAVRMKLFEALVKQKGSAITTFEISKLCNAENLLVSRIMRLLASMNYVAEASSETWLANETTHAMAVPAIAAGHRFVWDVQVDATAQAPRFLEETGFTCPTSASDGFIQYAHRTKYDVFEYMAKVRPDRLKDFHLFMGNTMGSRSYWFDWYPVRQQILADYDAAAPLLVDVGGGKGHDIISFANRFATEGQLILQDIEPALATIAEQDRDARITYQAQDFFKPNQVSGARVYFMHHILHDWSEEYALQILRNLRAVMKPGYSKLLIHDLVLPDQGANQYQATWDMVMMTFNAGIERSRSQWSDLLRKAGLRLEGVWHGDGGQDADGIVQAVVDELVKTAL